MEVWEGKEGQEEDPSRHSPHQLLHGIKTRILGIIKVDLEVMFMVPIIITYIESYTRMKFKKLRKKRKKKTIK